MEIEMNNGNTPKNSNKSPFRSIGSEKSGLSESGGATPNDLSLENQADVPNTYTHGKKEIKNIPRMNSVITMMAAAHYEAGDHWVRMVCKPYHATPLLFQIESERRMTAAFESLINSLGYDLTYMPTEEGATAPSSSLSSSAGIDADLVNEAQEEQVTLVASSTVNPERGPFGQNPTAAGSFDDHSYDRTDDHPGDPLDDPFEGPPRAAAYPPRHRNPRLAPSPPVELPTALGERVRARLRLEQQILTRATACRAGTPREPGAERAPSTTVTTDPQVPISGNPAGKPD
jgi:hypothetical protein